MICLVVPCFNEAKRLSLPYWESLIALPSLHVVFVDDGSTDETLSALVSLLRFPNVSCEALDRNMGKSEAVRRGLLVARNVVTREGDIVGYLDADGAFGIPDLLRLFEMATYLLADGRYDAVFASRVRLAGREVTRSAKRHYAGRAFATLASTLTGIKTYDSQAGFKLFSRDSLPEEVLATPMQSRWLVDIELYLRCLRHSSPIRIWEEPLHFWREVGDSKLTLGASLHSVHELLTLVFKSKSWRDRSS